MQDHEMSVIYFLEGMLPKQVEQQLEKGGANMFKDKSIRYITGNMNEALHGEIQIILCRMTARKSKLINPDSDGFKVKLFV